MKNLLLMLAIGLMLFGCEDEESNPELSDSDKILSAAFENEQSTFQIQGVGIVNRLLSDDDIGSQHQRFILELYSGQTLFMVHNIDLAARIDVLQVSDVIEFYGEYEWNSEGGLIHWTHHDPNGIHENGWLKHDGIMYQ